VIPDINVLIAAFRNDHAHHQSARTWLIEAIAVAQPARPVQLLPVVIAGFLRLATNKKVFSMATPIPQAVAFIDALVELPMVEIVSDASSWETLRKLCITKNLSDNAIPDAWIAAAAIDLSEHVVTFDKDFRKLLSKSQVTVLLTQS
jgi:uncharacterized protein